MTKTTSLSCFLAVAASAAGCTLSVPAPWDEWGVPGDALVEVAAGTSSTKYIAVYDRDPRAVVSSFRAGLKRGRFSDCGGMVVDGSGLPRQEGSPPFQATGYLKKEGAIWEVRAVEVSAERTSVHVEQIPAAEIARIDAAQAARDSRWIAWHPQLARSGCLPPPATKPTAPASAPTAALSTLSAKKEPAGAVASRERRPARSDGASQAKGPSPRVAAKRSTGRLPPEAVRVVRRYLGRMRFCYESGRRTNPGLKGTVVVKLVVDPSGAVTTAADGGSDIANQAVVSCVVETFKRMSFPELKDRGNATFVYPIRFDPS